MFLTHWHFTVTISRIASKITNAAAATPMHRIVPFSSIKVSSQNTCSVMNFLTNGYSVIFRLINLSLTEMQVATGAGRFSFSFVEIQILSVIIITCMKYITDQIRSKSDPKSNLIKTKIRRHHHIPFSQAAAFVSSVSYDSTDGYYFGITVSNSDKSIV